MTDTLLVTMMVVYGLFIYFCIKCSIKVIRHLISQYKEGANYKREAIREVIAELKKHTVILEKLAEKSGN